MPATSSAPATPATPVVPSTFAAQATPSGPPAGPAVPGGPAAPEGAPPARRSPGGTGAGTDASAVYLEFLARDGAVAQRIALARLPFRVGRAYDNDLIVDDPHVAPHHLRIEAEADGTLVARDLSTHNGLYALAAGRRPRRVARLPLADDTQLRIGLSGLRVRAADHPVAPEAPLAPERLLDRPALPALALLAVLGLGVYEAWVAAVGPRDTDGLLMLPLTLAGAVALWGGAWALLSRLFTHRARFGVHLAIGALGALAIEAVATLVGALGFATGSTLLAGHAYLVVYGGLGPVVLMHLRRIQPTHPVRNRVVAAVIALAAAGVPALMNHQQQGTTARPSFLAEFSWPWLRLRGAVAPDAFFADAAGLRAAVDEAAADVGAEAGEAGDEEP